MFCLLRTNRIALYCAVLLPLLGSLPAVAEWKLIWSDEFDQPNGSSPDANKWVFETGAGGWGNGELQYYTSRTNNARVENGQLVIEAKQESFSGSSYTSARLKTQGKWSWTYGRFEARIKIPRTQGIWPAFWMLGTNISSGVGWPGCGEIDIMENVGFEPTQVHGTIHGPGYSGGAGIGGAMALPGNPAFADDFHVYAVEWTTNQIKWFVDGYQYFSSTPASLPAGSAWVFKAPQFLLLNVAVGGVWPGNPDGTTIFPQRMLVDYVRVYSATNLPVCNPNFLGNSGLESSTFGSWTTYGAGFNTLRETIAAVRVHEATNVFKVFGQFTGAENYSGMLQDLPISAGQTLNAGGWMLTPSDDAIAGANTAWLEVSFRDSATNMLALYRSAVISTATPTGVWLYLPVTNQFNPANFSLIGSVTNLLAPTGTTFARYQVVFRQPQSAAGAVLFDDLRLASATTTLQPIPNALARSPGGLGLYFPTYLGLAYQVRYRNDLANGTWQALTNLVGDGSVLAAVDALANSNRFYQVVRVCN